MGVDDMILLDELTSESLINNVRVRYEADLVYTYTGSILVAVNPVRSLVIRSLLVAISPVFFSFESVKIRN